MGGRTTGVARALLLSLVLLAPSCTFRDPPAPSPVGRAGQQGLRGGVLRIVNQRDVDSLDPATAHTVAARALMRAYTRSLYGFKSSPDDRAAEPVPDLAAGPAVLSADKRTYTFTLRPGVQFAQPVSRDIRPRDFVYAVERQLRRGRPPLNPYASLIRGVDEFASGRARSISGMRVLSAHTLAITLKRPAPDFLSIVALPAFSPVPEEHAARYRPGLDYSGHVVGSGPYTLERWVRGQYLSLVRNRNWEPDRDPLRQAWVDRVHVAVGLEPGVIRRQIEQGEADLAVDGVPPPNDDLERLSRDTRLSRQFSVKTVNCIRYLSLQTDSGPTRSLEVRQAVNYALDKASAVQAAGGPFTGEPASTILLPTQPGYAKYDLYPSAESRGDVDQAKRKLAAAGYPTGVTLTMVTDTTGPGPALTTALREALQRAGIALRVTSYRHPVNYLQSLELTSKRDEHQVGLASWCADYPGDSARSVIGVLLDGRTIVPAGNRNYGNYHNPQVSRLLDAVLAEPDADSRAALWGQLDKRIMRDAPWAPLAYERGAFFWSARVKNWTFSPWVSNPDLTNLWLEPNDP